MNEDKQEAGGIYLFTGKQSLQQFRHSALSAVWRQIHLFTDINVKEFSPAEQDNLVINAPLYPFSLLSTIRDAG